MDSQVNSNDELIGTPREQSEYTYDMMLAELQAINDHNQSSSSEPLADDPVIIVGPNMGELDLYDDLELPVRWANYFNQGGIYNVADLVGKSEDELYSIAGIGKAAISLLEEALAAKGLPSLSAFTIAELSQYYKPTRHAECPVIRPATNAICVNPFETEEDAPKIDLENVSLFQILPQGERVNQILDYADNVTLSELNTVYECIPPVLRQISYFEDEPLSVLLDHTINYSLIDFGYKKTKAMYRELISNLASATPFVDSSASFVQSVKRSMPKTLLSVRTGCFHFLQRINLPKSLTIEDLLDDDTDVVSGYIAYSVAQSLTGLLTDYRAPVTLKELFEKSVTDSEIKYGQRNLNIVSRYLGIGVEASTLETVAAEHGMTRQRVQQIVRRFRESYDITKLPRLLPFRLCVTAEAVGLGCIGRIDALEAALYDVSVIGHGERIAGTLSLLPEFEIDARKGIFRVNTYPCPSCDSVKRAMDCLVKEQAVISIDSFMQTIGCNDCPHCLKPRFEHLPLDSRLLSTDSIIGPKDHPKLAIAKDNKSIRARVHAVLLNSERALTANEIMREYEKLFTDSVTKASVLSHLSNYDDVILWGRATYIHVNYAPFPKELIMAVATKCRELFLKNNIPILGIGAVFQLFKHRLTESGVPTEHALYSLLRRLNDEDLSLKEYPWVCDEKTIGDRTTFAKYFGDVMQSHNGYISDAEATDLTRRAMTQSFQLSGLQQYKKNLIHADDGTYDLDMIDINYESFDEFIYEIAAPMDDGELVSARAVFTNYRSRLVAMGIRSYEMLYRILDMREDHLPMNASRLPHLIKSDRARITVREAMRSYIQRAGQPVSLEELREEFVGRRGVAKSNVSPFFFLGNGIVTVGDNLFAWEETLHNTQPNLSDVEEALDAYCSNAMEKARLFYDVDLAISYAPLPNANAVRWNRDLLYTILSRSENYRVMGPEKSALVSIRRHPSIDSEETFFVELLSKEFHGFVTWRDFTTRIERLGIATNLRPEYFASMSSIEANEIVIKIRR